MWKQSPPSVLCKQLYAEIASPTAAQMANLSTQCFGTPSKVSEISKWFALKRSLQFAKAEAKLKRRCGAVTPSVLSDVERLLRQTRGLFGMNGQCTVANLKLLLGNHGLTTSGPKVELVQRVHNNIARIRESQGLQSKEAISMLEEDGPNEDEDVEDDLICFVCLTGDVSEGNDIVICDGDHSEPRGCHQLCCQPPVFEIPDGPWLCPDCLQDHGSAPPSRGTDADYVPSVTCTDATSASASSSNSSSSSDSSDGTSDSSDDSSSDSSSSSSSDSDDSSGSASD